MRSLRMTSMIRFLFLSGSAGILDPLFAEMIWCHLEHSFRQGWTILRGLAIFLAISGFVQVARAQGPIPFTCDSTAPAVQMRAEGLAEKGGDFVLTCTGGTPIDPGASAPTVDIQVFLNTNVTSRILTAATGATDALLLVDEPAVADQKVCPVGTSCP